MANIYQLGFITGKQKVVIPWGLFLQNPSLWMSAECYPDDFEWKDPSKLRIGPISQLLAHWRNRHSQGLDPLIWLPTCPLLSDVVRRPEHEPMSRQATELQVGQTSDDEDFILPAGGDSSEESGTSDDESAANRKTSDEEDFILPESGDSDEHSDRSDGNASGGEEEIRSDVEYPGFSASLFGEYYIYVFMLNTHIFIV